MPPGKQGMCQITPVIVKYAVLLSSNLFPGNAKFYVENDAVAALASGTMGKLHGCVLIAGTGSIAYGVTEDGKVARAAGAGPVLGDWGRWAYADPSWARIAALVPVVVSAAEDGDKVANTILHDAVQELAESVVAVVRRLTLCGEDGKDQFPLVLVGGVLEGNKKWDISGEVIKCISKVFPGVCPIRPEVSMRTNIRCYEIFAILWGLNILRLWTVWWNLQLVRRC
uniref:N-acetyl-D-glucosamine kinase n=1 Tax=Aegilops tauschii subsp. strangulata TaxID=200361 RepID=A0A453S0C4_AEGTS